MYTIAYVLLHRLKLKNMFMYSLYDFPSKIHSRYFHCVLPMSNVGMLGDIKNYLVVSFMGSTCTTCHLYLDYTRTWSEQ